MNMLYSQIRVKLIYHLLVKAFYLGITSNELIIIANQILFTFTYAYI